MLALNEKAVEWKPVDDEVMALDVERREYFAVNGSGTVLWSLLANGTTERAMVEALTDRYGIDDLVAAEGVTQFVSTLDGRGLLLRS